jgi:hypothetical protein
MVKTILEDGRDIKQLQLGIGEGARNYTVDEDENTLFTKLEPYMDSQNTLCFAVYDGGEEPVERIQFKGFIAVVIYFKD